MNNLFLHTQQRVNRKFTLQCLYSNFLSHSNTHIMYLLLHLHPVDRNRQLGMVQTGNTVWLIISLSRWREKFIISSSQDWFRRDLCQESDMEAWLCWQSRWWTDHLLSISFNYIKKMRNSRAGKKHVWNNLLWSWKEVTMRLFLRERGEQAHQGAISKLFPLNRSVIWMWLSQAKAKQSSLLNPDCAVCGFEKQQLRKSFSI